MNNRKIFRPVAPVRPGIDMIKCLALVSAAYNGDTEEAVRLASDPQVDINFLACCFKDRAQGQDDDEYHSALSAALIQNRVEIVLFLLQQGAYADIPASKHYYSFRSFQSVLSIACTKNFPTDLSLFKPLLRATKELNHDFDGWSGSGTLIKFLTKDGLTPPDRSQRVSLFFHEAVLRSDSILIDEFLSHTKSITFNEESFKEYLDDIDLTSDQALRTCKILDYLAEIEFITKETSRKIKAFIFAKTKFTIEINEFPIQLQQSVAKPTNRSLQELFAELQHWILPNEELPPGLADGAFIKTKDFNEEELKRIRSFQDPKRLRQYMEIDPSELLTMLYHVNSPQGENPAAILLSQILMFHGGALLDDNKSLFNEDQEKRCFLVLKRLYSLSDSEKLTLILHRTHGEDLRELRYENSVLQQQVEDSKAKIEALEAKVNQFVAMVQRMQAQPAQSEQQDKFGMKRPHSPTFKF